MYDVFDVLWGTRDCAWRFCDGLPDRVFATRQTGCLPPPSSFSNRLQAKPSQLAADKQQQQQHAVVMMQMRACARARVG